MEIKTYEEYVVQRIYELEEKERCLEDKCFELNEKLSKSLNDIREILSYIKRKVLV